MNKIKFSKIDRLHDPQRFISATFDNEYVRFVKAEKQDDKPEVVVRTECLQDLLKWIDDESATKVFGFDCKTDNQANVFNISLADQWILLHYTNENKLVHHAFLSIKSLSELVKKIEGKKQS